LIPAVQLVSVATAVDDRIGAVTTALAAVGWTPAARIFVEDDEPALERALVGEVAVTVIVVGPGARAEELVRRTLARVAGVRLVAHERMEALLRRRGRPQAERLALLPDGADLWATSDAEPAWALESRGRAFVVLPQDGSAAPALLERLTSFVRPRLGGGDIAARTLRVTGPGLAAVEERLAGRAASDAVAVTVLAAEGEVWVRLRARGATPDAAAAALDRAEAALVSLLGEDCYGRDGETLERVLGAVLAERKLTLAVAESCTGGLLGHRLTSVPGSSRYFERGVMVYSNRAKEELLGVPAEVLAAHGAVSGPCAEAMAAGMRRVAGTDCALAVTGIAGPDGGTPTKPVGTVFVGMAVGDDVRAERFHFDGDRAAIKWQSAQAALDLLRRRLLAAPEPGR
jgi:nicotinamide-nucleotide amidase